jgi:hypothetical protein
LSNTPVIQRHGDIFTKTLTWNLAKIRRMRTLL